MAGERRTPATALVRAVIPIGAQADVERARRETRALALALAFPAAEAEVAALAGVELATNVLRYAQGGRLTIVELADARGVGLRIVSDDDGPGIGDLSRALQDGYSTGGGLGSGLPAVRRLMDEFTIATGPAGTRIVACKWLDTP